MQDSSSSNPQSNQNQAASLDQNQGVSVQSSDVNVNSAAQQQTGQMPASNVNVNPVPSQQQSDQTANVLNNPRVPAVNQDEKIWAGISYVPMVAVVSLLIKPQSDFVRLHARQGLLIFVLFFFNLFVYLILPPLGPLIAGLIQLGCFIIGVYSLFQAFLGNWWKIPVLGDIADKIPVELFTKAATEALTGQPPSEPDNSDSQNNQQN